MVVLHALHVVVVRLWHTIYLAAYLKTVREVAVRTRRTCQTSQVTRMKTQLCGKEFELSAGIESFHLRLEVSILAFVYFPKRMQ